MRSRARGLAVAVGALVAVTACGSPHSPVAGGTAQPSGVSGPSGPAATRTAGTSDATGPGGSPGGGAASTGAARSSGAAGPTPSSSGTRAASPSAPPPSYPTDVPVRASVSPRCVRQGETVTLTVHTQSKASIAYGARYSDGGYGAPPPLGKGYGGSGHGTATDGGGWETTFTVAPEAPSGAVTVDVLVAWRGKGGSTAATFQVGC
jgi:hypothetical protein